MKKVLRIVSLLCVAAMALAMFSACGESGPSEGELTKVREALIKEKEISGLGNIDKMEFYENGERTTSDKYVQAKDNKKIYWSGDIKRVVNYADGYSIDIPTTWVPDFSMSEQRVRYDADDVTLIASDEQRALSAYGSAEDMMATIFQFMDTPEYLKENKVADGGTEKKIKITDKFTATVKKMTLKDCAEGVKSHYTYVCISDNLKYCYWLMFKCVDDRDFADVYKTFSPFAPKGAKVNTLSFKESENENWNDETKAFYKNVKNSDKIDWGLFLQKLDSTGWSKLLPNIEKKTNYTFPLISQYYHFKSTVSAETAKKVYDSGRYMQISYQFTTSNNTDLQKYTPVLDIYRGKKDDQLREFARSCAAIGKPFYFRLNNEMDTDWTSYCGECTMLDPDIFVANWERLYNIFKEEGASPYCIWIFNGLRASFPPLGCLDTLCYAPDAKYFDVFGVSEYSFDGSISFEKLYNESYSRWGELFKDWAWVITEFGCSQVKVEATNPDFKENWIKEMGDVLASGKYPNIKAAIWFNSSDYATDGTVTNRINLDESAAIMKAFGEAAAKTQSGRPAIGAETDATKK